MRLGQIIFIQYLGVLQKKKMGCAQPSTAEPLGPGIDNKKFRANGIHNRKNVNPDEITEAIEILSNKLSEEQVLFAVTKLSDHQLFGTLNKRELKVIAQEMVLVKPKDTKGFIFHQGDVGTCFFLIIEGEVGIEIDDKHVRTLKSGETFGELALLFRSPRTASAISMSKETQFLVVKPMIYKKTLKKMRMEEQYKNSETIEKVPLFSCLTNKQKFALSNTIKIMMFNPGEVIFRAGDDAQAMYIISEGNIKIEIVGKKDIELHSGEIFGEASIQDNMKRSGTAKAVTRAMCSMISRKDIENTLGASINNLIFYNTKKWAVMRSPIFKNLPNDDLNRLIISFDFFTVANKQVIDNSIYEGFIICLQGDINKQKQGKVFNQQNWVDKKHKCEQKLVKNGAGYCAFLSFTKAEEIFEDINNRKKIMKYRDKNKQTRNNFNLTNFTYIKKLGEGQFGQVYLAKNVQFGSNLYAVKCLSKEYIKSEELEDSVIQEKKILEKIIFPYIVGFVKAFHDKKYVYLVMEYIHGKELFDVIREVKSMTADMIRYYIGCLLLSVEYLHSNNIVYRDLKPQNSVIDYQGKAYLIDMGTAKELNSENFFKTFTIIGTPHYMAPEVFEGNGYSFEVDLWSLGCILYEFLCFKLPFGENSQSDPYAVFTSIKKTNLTFPKFVKDEKAKKLLTSLLTKQPLKRSEFSFDKIKKSDYFKGFNWSGLLEEDMKGPYIPRQYRENTLSNLHKIEGKDFLQHIYNNKKSTPVEEWNHTF